MKLGGSVIGSWRTAEEWQALLKSTRFSAIPSPVDSRTDRQLAREVISATREAGVVISEAGVWKNVLAPDEKTREEAVEYAKAQLAFADEHGIPCCVNIAGSLGPVWDGAHKDNYTQRTYDLLVASVQGIIDGARPSTACYTLEPMPWMLPDGPDEYLQLLADINRERFAVHLDYVNMINSPRRALYAHEFIEECAMKLGKYTLMPGGQLSLLEPGYTAIIRELPPGQGGLDFSLVLGSLHRHLPENAPVLLEHMNSFEAYARAFAHVERAAQATGIPIR